MQVVKSPLAFVRRTGGGTVALHQGATVPDDADGEHVTELLAAGVLARQKAPAPKPAAKSRAAQDTDD